MRAFAIGTACLAAILASAIPAAAVDDFADGTLEAVLRDVDRNAHHGQFDRETRSLARGSYRTSDCSGDPHPILLERWHDEGGAKAYYLYVQTACGDGFAYLSCTQSSPTSFVCEQDGNWIHVDEGSGVFDYRVPGFDATGQSPKTFEGAGVIVATAPFPQSPAP